MWLTLYRNSINATTESPKNGFYNNSYCIHMLRYVKCMSTVCV